MRYSRRSTTISFFLFFAALMMTLSASADWGINQSYIIVEAGNGNQYFAGGINSDEATAFNGLELGSFAQGASLTLNGGELKTWKNGGSNVCGGSLFYRVYPSGAAAGDFASVALGYAGELGGGNQKWEATAAGINLASDLAAGDYVIDVWWQAEGNQYGGCGEFNYDSNNGANFQATFTVLCADSNSNGFCDSDEFTIDCYYGDDCQGGMIDLCMDSDGATIATIGTTDYSGSSVLEVTLSGAPSWMVLSANSYAIGPDYPDDFNHIFVTFSSTPENGNYSYNLVVTDPATGYAVTVPVSTQVMGDSNSNGFCDSDEFTIDCYYGDNCQGGMIDLCMDSDGATIATIGTTDYSGSSVLEVTLSGAPSWMVLSANSYAIGPDYPDDFNHIFVTFTDTPENGNYSYNLVVTDPATGYAVTVPVSTQVMGDSNANGICDSDEFTIDCYYGDNCQGGMIDLCMDSDGATIATIGTTDYSGSSVLEVTLSGAPSWMVLSANSYAIGPDYPDDFNHIFVTFTDTPENGNYSYNLVVTDPATGYAVTVPVSTQVMGDSNANGICDSDEFTIDCYYGDNCQGGMIDLCMDSDGATIATIGTTDYSGSSVLEVTLSGAPSWMALSPNSYAIGPDYPDDFNHIFVTFSSTPENGSYSYSLVVTDPATGYAVTVPVSTQVMGDSNANGICDSDEFTIDCYYGDNCQGGMIDLCMDSDGATIATIGTTDYSGSSVLEVTLSGAPSWMVLSANSYAIGPDYPDDFNHIFVTFTDTPENGNYSYNLVVTDPATGYAVTVPVSTQVMGDSNANGICDSDEFTIDCYYGDNCQGGMIDLCMDSDGATIATIGTTDYSGSSVLEVTLSGAPSWMVLSANSYAIGPDYPDDFNHIFVTFTDTPENGNYSYNLVVTDPATGYAVTVPVSTQVMGDSNANGICDSDEFTIDCYYGDNCQGGMIDLCMDSDGATIATIGTTDYSGSSVLEVTLSGAPSWMALSPNSYAIGPDYPDDFNHIFVTFSSTPENGNYSYSLVVTDPATGYAVTVPVSTQVMGDSNANGICDSDEFTIDCYYGDNCQGGMIDLCMDSDGATIATIGTTDYSGSSVLEVTLSGAPSWMALSPNSYAIGPDYPDDFNHIFVTFSSTPENGNYSYNLVVTDPATGYAVTVPVSTQVMGDSNSNGFCDSDEFTIDCYYGDNCQGGMIDLCMDSDGATIATIGTTDYSGSSVLEVTLSGAPSWMVLSANSYAIGPDYPDDFNHIFVTFSSTPVNGNYSYNLVVTDPATGYAVTVPVSTQVMGDSNANGICDSDEFTIDCYYGDNCQGGMIDLCMDSDGATIATIGTTDYSGSSVLEVTLSGAPSWMALSPNSYAIGPDYPDDFNHIFVTFSSTPVNGNYSYNLVVTDPATGYAVTVPVSTQVMGDSNANGICDSDEFTIDCYYGDNCQGGMIDLCMDSDGATIATIGTTDYSGSSVLEVTLSGAPSWMALSPNSYAIGPDYPDDFNHIFVTFTDTPENGNYSYNLVVTDPATGYAVTVPVSTQVMGSDSDGDGICDAEDNCSDTSACNYDDAGNGSCLSVDACGVCGGSGIPAGDCDCNGNELDALGVCGGSCAADADDDGVCDDVDPCVGALDACGVCNGPGAIYACGCSDIPEGDCDCNGNELDALGDCGGSCTADVDDDGVCDDVDPCVGALDACGVCNGPGAIYACGCSDIPEGDCDCDGTEPVQYYDCAGACLNDTDSDGICDENEVAGCTNQWASNYNESATDDNGSCVLPSFPFMHVEAVATSEVGTTYHVSIVFENVTDACDALYSIGTSENNPLGQYFSTTTTFYQHAAGADFGTEINSSFAAVDPFYGQDSWFTIGAESSDEGTITAIGMTDPLNAFNLGEDVVMEGAVGASWFVIPGASPAAIAGDDQKVLIAQLTVTPNSTDSSPGHVSGVVNVQWRNDSYDVTMNEQLFFSSLGDASAVLGCTDPSSCNYDSTANVEDGSCTVEDVIGVCGGSCTADADNDGICDDVDSCVGSLDACGVCNGPGAIYDCGCSDIPEGECDCNGNELDALGVCGGSCAADADDDGICDDVDSCVGSLDACGVCNGPGAIYDCGCSGIPTGDCDCEGTEPLQGYDCSGNCLTDTDQDGVCDEFEVAGCTDSSACNYNDAATDDNSTCTYASSGYDCSGACLADSDSDGICDADDNCSNTSACNYDDAGNESCLTVDACGICGGDNSSCADDCGVPNGDNSTCADCAGVPNGTSTLDECGVCNGPGAIYDCGCSDIPAGECDCDGNQLDVLGDCGGTCTADADSDGVCDDVDDCVGTPDALGVCNGSCTADADSDGVCDDVDDCVGTPDALGVCNGSCTADADSDGVCDDVDDCVGTPDALGVCNGSCTADADSDGVCDDVDDCVGTPDALGVCNGSCTADADSDGICDDVDSCVGTTDALGVCNGTCTADENNDGICDSNEVQGCMDSTACNYNESANVSDSSCTYATTWYADVDGDSTGHTYTFVESCTQPAGYVATSGDTCPNDSNKLSPGTCGCGNVDVDVDADGLCDSQDGCTDNTACNYTNPVATSCLTINSCGNCAPATTVTCGLQGACNYDATGDCYNDALCDFASCAGCMNSNACNYDAAASISAPLTCTFPDYSWEDCDGNCLNDSNSNGICDEVDVQGCTDNNAINYNPNATVDNGTCFTEIVGCIIPSATNYDPAATVQGSPLTTYCTFPPSVPVPWFLMTNPGCMDSNACNYDATATTSDGSCEYTSCQGCDVAGACNYDASVLYNDGSCEWTSCLGCMNSSACDYDATATIADTCDFDSCQGCTNSAASNYDATATQDDGSCIIDGCTHASACNYDATATNNDGSCTYAAAYYDCNGDCNNDSDSDGVCDELEVNGCTNASACNYDATATEDDGSCTLPTTWYADTDGDGAGDSATTQSSCVQPVGYVSTSTDNCPGNASKTEPGICGCSAADVDTDSDGVCDTSDNCTDTSACNYDDAGNGACTFADTYYQDADNDGLGNSAVTTTSCTGTAPTGYVSDSSDNCDNLLADNYSDGTNPPCTFASGADYAAIDSLLICDGGTLTLDLDTLHTGSSTGTWSYSLNGALDAFGAASISGSIITVNASASGTGRDTLSISGAGNGETADLSVIVQESTYPRLVSQYLVLPSTPASLDGGVQFTFEGHYDEPVAVEFLHHPTDTTDADGSLILRSDAYWISGFTNARGCMNPAPATGSTPTDSPAPKGLAIPYVLED